MADQFDLLVLGSRVRHARRRAGVTLAEAGELVNRPAPYLSQLETGKVEPKLTLLGELAEILGTTTADFLSPDPPNRRAFLEISLARAQSEPAYRALGLPRLKPSAKVADDVLEHLVALWDELGRQSSEMRQDRPTEARFADVARSANIALRAEMRERANHYPEIEAIAAQALADANYPGTGPISERVLTELVANQGFTIERVRAMPPTARSITDTRDKIIFIPTEGV